MAGYNLREKLRATQQSLLKEYECQVNKVIEENAAILSHLSQCDQVGEPVQCQGIQQALYREKKNVSKWVTLQNLNEELLSIAEEQHQQLGAHALSSSTQSQSKAEEQERVRPKAEMTSAEVANISQQCAALLRELVFNTVLGTVNVRRGAAAQTPSISSEEGEAGILQDMLDQMPQVPDTPFAGSQRVCFMEPIHQASTPMVGGNVSLKIGMSYVEPE